jgi:HK97 family phage portal protein
VALNLASSNKSQVQLEGTIKAITVRGRSREFGALDGGAGESDAPYFGGSFVKPRFTPSSWVSLAEQSTRLRRCCEVMARNVCGLGAYARVHPDAYSQSKGRRNLTNSVQRDLDNLQELLLNPNPIFDPISEVFYKVEYDYHASGNGYLEVVEDDREAGTQVMSLLHVPCVKVRVHKSRDVFVRMLTHSNRRVYFRRFGDADPAHRFINRITGDLYEEWPEDLPASERGTSLIHFKSYCPLDDFYGMPTVVPAVNSVVGNKLASTWNINFLHNNAHIPLAVVVENGNLSPDSMEQIELFLSREAKGISNAGRIMVLQPDMNRMMQGGNLKIKLEPLNIGVSDDASFLKYRDRNDVEIQETFGLSSILLGLGGAQTRATANAAKQVSISNVIHPRTQTWEYMLNATIGRRASNGVIEIVLKRATNLDSLQEASVIQKLMGAMTVNDVRAHASKLLQDDQILPLGDAIGKMPMASLRNFKPGAEDIDDLLDRLDSATPDRGHIRKVEDIV